MLSLGSGTGGSHQKQLLGMPEAPRVEQGHVALSNPSPLPFRGVPGDCSQPWDDRKVLLDLGPLMGSGFKTWESCAQNASPRGSKEQQVPREEPRG